MTKWEEEMEDEHEDDFLIRAVPRFKYSSFLGNRESGLDHLDSIFTFIALILAFFLLVSLPWVGNSGGVRWLVIILALGIVATLLMKIFHNKTSPLVTWRNQNELDIIVGSRLNRTSNLVNRSSKGLETSRAMLEGRLMDDFVEKMKQERGYSPDHIDELLEDNDRLIEEVDDDVITEFLINCNHYRELCRENKSLSSRRSFKKDEDYRRKIIDLINRMEDWS